MPAHLTAADVKRRAAALGFDRCGIASAQAYPELASLHEWLGRGYAGRMTYMNRTARKRSDPRQWLPSARSLICVACSYHTNRPLSVERTDPDRGVVARYAWGDDYHDVLTTRLERLLAWMRDVSPEPFDARIGVDDAPVQERVFAARAGIGWVGKNTCVIDPELGSFLVLGEIVTSLPLDPDEPVLDRCGTCRLCLDACPTGALIDPYVLDGRRCLSYLTIELRDGVPEPDRGRVGRHLFGCDICQDVCPHNTNAPTSADPAWQPRGGLEAPVLADLWLSADTALEPRIAGTALRRRGIVGLRRTTAVALANRGGADAAAVLARTPEDAPSTDEASVRRHREWALRHLHGK